MSEIVREVLQAELDAVGCRWGATEAHGTLVGLACSSLDSAIARWIGEIQRESESPSQDALESLRALGDEGLREIRGEYFQFKPLLPDDDTPMSERAGELAHWCQGFLYGFALAGQNPLSDGPGDVPEAMADLAEITRAGFDEDQPVDEAEESYAELVEFVRVAAQLVYYEMAMSRQPDRDSEGI